MELGAVQGQGKRGPSGVRTPKKPFLKTLESSPSQKPGTWYKKASSPSSVIGTNPFPSRGLRFSVCIIGPKLPVWASVELGAQVQGVEPPGLRQPFCSQMDKGFTLQAEWDDWGQERDSGSSWPWKLQ